MSHLLPTITPGIAPWWYYLCVGASVLIVGISKAGFGGGVGILAIPVMALVMPPQHMLGVMLPVLIMADILSNLHYLREYEWRLLTWLLIGALIGVGLGTIGLLLLRTVDERSLQQVLSATIGFLCLFFVLWQLLGLTGRTMPTLPSGPASSVAVGVAAGGVSTIAHSAGPIVTLYMLQEKVPKRRFVGTLLMYFLLINTAKLPTFISLGLINKRTLADSIWFLPILALGTLLGAWMNRKVAERPFAAIMYVMAAVAAGAMVYKALWGG